MIANPETIARMRKEALAYPDDVLHGMQMNLTLRQYDMLHAALRAAFLAGADAGYTARVAEERKP